jgi:putative ABC transport system permease protein
VEKHFSTIRQALLNAGVVENAALSDHETLYGGYNTDGLTWPGKAPDSKVLLSGRNVTPDFFATSGIKILSGRNLQESDSLYTGGSVKKLNMVVTQSLATMMGPGSAV